MRTFRAFFAAAACAAAALTLSACSVIESDTEALMSPPRLTDEQNALHAALAQVAGEGYTLVYPKTEDSFSAFIFRDLDGDGEDEAMVFYVAESAENDTRMNILKKSGGSWESVYSISGGSSQVEAVYFAAMSRDEATVLIGWGLSGGEKDLALYRYGDGGLDTLYTGPYSEFSIIDMDGDGYEDIVLFGGHGSFTGSARMLSKKYDAITESDEVEMTAQAGSFIAVTEGKLTGNRRALFVDSQLSEESYITEVIWFSGGSLQRLTAPTGEDTEEKQDIQVSDPASGQVLVSEAERLSEPPHRSTAALCRDMNGDGLTDIPVQSALPGTAEDDGEAIPLTRYLKWDGEEFTAVWSGVVNVDDGYAFEYPEHWIGLAGAEGDSITGEWRFYLYLPDENGAIDTVDPPELLRIRAAAAGDYQDRFEENYYLLEKSGAQAYYCYIPPGVHASYRLTNEECQRLFTLMD